MRLATVSTNLVAFTGDSQCYIFQHFAGNELIPDTSFALKCFAGPYSHQYDHQEALRYPLTYYYSLQKCFSICYWSWSRTTMTNYCEDVILLLKTCLEYSSFFGVIQIKYQDIAEEIAIRKLQQLTVWRDGHRTDRPSYLRGLLSDKKSSTQTVTSSCTWSKTS